MALIGIALLGFLFLAVFGANVTAGVLKFLGVMALIVSAVVVVVVIGAVISADREIDRRAAIGPTDDNGHPCVEARWDDPPAPSPKVGEVKFKPACYVR